MLLLSSALKFVFGLTVFSFIAACMIYMVFLTLVTVCEVIAEIIDWFRGDSWDK